MQAFIDLDFFDFLKNKHIAIYGPHLPYLVNPETRFSQKAICFSKSFSGQFCRFQSSVITVGHLGYLLLTIGIAICLQTSSSW